MAKRFAIFVLIAPALPVASGAATPNFPTLSGRVVDDAAILRPALEREITALLAEHENKTSNQVVVVTLPTLQGFSIEDFGYQLGRHWAIGQQGRNNGVLLIVAPNERKVRIEVGYGLEGTLTDALGKTIIEAEIVPRFKAGDYPQGISAGVTAILATIEGTYEPSPEYEKRNRGSGVPIFTILLLAAVFLVAVLASFLNRPFLSGDRYTGYHGSGRGSSGYGGSGGGLGGGGGGFSGGGGGFGGGGSSGSW